MRSISRKMCLGFCMWSALVALAFLAAPAAVQAEDPPVRLPLKTADEIAPLLRSDHFGVYMQGGKTGWARLALVKREGPTPAYISEMEICLKFADAGVKTELLTTEALEFDATAPFALRRAASRETDGRTTHEVTVTRNDKGFEAVIRDGQDQRRKQLTAVDLTLADTLGPQLWLRRGAKLNETLKTRMFDLDELTIEDEIRKFVATKKTTSDGVQITYHELDVTAPKLGFSGKERYVDGAERLLSITLAGLFDLRVEAEQTAKDVQFAGDLFELGKVPVDRKLGDDADLQSLVLETVGKHELQLRSGPRQTVTKNDAGTYTLKLGKPFATPTPATETELKDNLLETSSYPVQHEQIQKLAQEAIGDARSPEEKVRRLVRFVAKYIKPSYTAQPLTVLEIVRKREGDCSEYARLFTTLARAAGLSTRDVGGLAYLGDEEQAFGFHAWNEVVLNGQWKAVDATAGRMEITPGYVSFGHLPGEMAANIGASLGKVKLRVVELREK